ncbi:MAG: dephospho-CoA kinase [Neptuniibacter sp.]
MFVVGITGGIGSGKTAVTSTLEQFGIEVVDADIVARQVVEPGSYALTEITKHFGPELLNNDGTLDRQQLRSIVFKSDTERKWLESLLHPAIRTIIKKQLNEAKSKYCILASPLLLESDQHLLTDYIVVIDLDEELQIQRTTTRDNNSEEQIRSIIAAQMSREKRIQKADYVITNDSDLKELKSKVKKLHQTLLLKAKECNVKT